MNKAYRVRLTDRALRDLRSIYAYIDAASSAQGAAWFNRLEQLIFGLASFPYRGAVTQEDSGARQLTHGRKPHVYRVIYEIDEQRAAVFVLHIRGPGRDAMKRRPSRSR